MHDWRMDQSSVPSSILADGSCPDKARLLPASDGTSPVIDRVSRCRANIAAALFCAGDEASASLGLVRCLPRDRRDRRHALSSHHARFRRRMASSRSRAPAAKLPSCGKSSIIRARPDASCCTSGSASGSAQRMPLNMYSPAPSGSSAREVAPVFLLRVRRNPALCCASTQSDSIQAWQQLCDRTCSVLLNSISDTPSWSPPDLSRTTAGNISCSAEKREHRPHRATISSSSPVLRVASLANSSAICLFEGDP